MATLSVTIPNNSPVIPVLLDVAQRDGFEPANNTVAAKQAALQEWLLYRVRRIYTEQAQPIRREQAATDVESALGSEAQTIT